MLITAIAAVTTEMIPFERPDIDQSVTTILFVLGVAIAFTGLLVLITVDELGFMPILIGLVLLAAAVFVAIETETSALERHTESTIEVYMDYTRVDVQGSSLTAEDKDGQDVSGYAYQEDDTLIVVIIDN